MQDLTNLNIQQLRNLKVMLIGFIKEFKREKREIDKAIKDRLENGQEEQKL